MKIYEAAISVLQAAARPMRPKEIHDEIVKRGLFKFGAKDPVAVLTQALRKKSDASSNKGEIIFVKKPNNASLPFSFNLVSSIIILYSQSS